MVLEQDHRRLNRVVDSKSAADAELADFHANERFEDSFVIHGLAAITDMVGKAWQEKAISDVQGVLQILFQREFSIVVVQNATSRVPGLLFLVFYFGALFHVSLVAFFWLWVVLL